MRRHPPEQFTMFELLGLEDRTGVVEAAPPQTQLKHEAYKRYIGRWMSILRHAPAGNHLYVHDLFAGPGVYLVDGAISPGTPVIAAEAALVAQAIGAEVRVHLRFVDQSRAVAERLEAEMGRFRPHVDAVVLRGHAEDHAGRLAEESRGHPTLVLLDPYGIGAPLETVALYGGRDYTEVLISFDAQAPLRVAGTKDAAALTAFWGDDSWLALRRPDFSLDPEGFLEGYRRRLQELAGFRFAIVRRVSFPRIHINRAIAQAAGSTLAAREWLESFKPAARRFDTRILEVVSPIDRRLSIDRALIALTAFGGRTDVLWGAIFREVAGACPFEEDVRQALFFLRELGLATWTSRLERYAQPAPRISFATTSPAGQRWDRRTRFEPPTRA